MNAGKCAGVGEVGEKKTSSIRRYQTIVAFETDYDIQWYRGVRIRCDLILPVDYCELRERIYQVCVDSDGKLKSYKYIIHINCRAFTATLEQVARYGQAM